MACADRAYAYPVICAEDAALRESRYCSSRF